MHVCSASNDCTNPENPQYPSKIGVQMTRVIYTPMCIDVMFMQLARLTRQEPRPPTTMLFMLRVLFYMKILRV